MSSINTNLVVISGRLAKNPALSYTQAGQAVTSLTVAVGDGTDAQGNDRTNFVQVSVWGKQAESAANYLAKGSQVVVSGKLIVRSFTSNKYKDENGQPATMWQTSVMANHVEFTSSKADNQRFAAAKNQQASGFQKQGPTATQQGQAQAPAQNAGFQKQAQQQAPANNAPFDGGVTVSEDDLPF